MRTPTALVAAMLLAAPAGLYADEKTDMMIKDALSAAPTSLRDKATVMDWDNNVLQKGSSDFVCYPTPPQLKGTAPMCLDGPWQKWAGAWMNKQDLQITQVGVSYMLAGDEGASNIDPYAEGETADNQWVKEGPHIMVIVPDPAMLEGLPTDPFNGGPYVMWKGTPYAHIMIPVNMK